MRIGHINFLNVLPLTFGYDHFSDRAFELTTGVPTKINRLLEEGALEISQLSSIAFARMSQSLVMLPEPCVRADCDVESIMLVSRVPIDRLDGEKIILTSKSETAQCLLKIILSIGYSLRPNYETRAVEPIEPIDHDASAALLIGDDALQLYYHRPKAYRCYDLGREWHRLTGRSMVYAVWAARRDLDRTSIERARDHIARSLRFGLEHKADAIRSILERTPFTFDQLDHYLGGAIKWDLTEDHLESLKFYFELAKKIGVLEQTPSIEIFPRG